MASRQGALRVIRAPGAGRIGRRVTRLLRALGVGFLGGFLAGALVGGVGGRLVMRIVALTAIPAAHGTLTANGNVVGRFTLAGSIGLLMDVAFFTAPLGGLLYLALRPWLAGLGRWRGPVVGLLGVVSASTVIDARNPDFTRLGSPLLNVALFAALPLLYGLVVVPLVDWLDGWLPGGPHGSTSRPRALVGYALLLPSVFLGVLLLVGFIAFIPEDIRTNDVNYAAIPTIYLLIAAPWLAMRRQRQALEQPGAVATSRPRIGVPGATTSDWVLLVLPFAVELTLTARSVAQVLTA
jgi:hypothetical protein